MAYAFGPYRLDAALCRLSRDGEPVALPDRYTTILLLLVAKAGTIVAERGPARRRMEGRRRRRQQPRAGHLQPAADPWLDAERGTLHRDLGQARVSVPCGGDSGEPRADDAALDALLAPHRAFTEGRSALETFDLDAVADAQRVFENIVAATPDYGPAHVGLANAHSFRFESTRADDAPDREALAKALQHAREGCRLNASSGEAWATLGGVLAQARLMSEGIAAARRSIALEDENWRHHLRFAYVSWGEERLRSARRALKLVPGFAFGHWLAASVHVSRGALAEAEHELEAGAVAQDQQHRESRFGSSGLHFLLGLVRLARGDEAGALREFEHELAHEEESHIYTRQVCAHTTCALGALRLRQGDRDAALAAFERAQLRIAGYPLAVAAAHAVRGSPRSDHRRALPSPRGSNTSVLKVPVSRPQRWKQRATHSPAVTPRRRRASMPRSKRRRLAAMPGCCRSTRS